METTIQITRGELDEAQEITVEVSGIVRIGSPASYWEPADPDEVEFGPATVAQSDHPGYPVGSTIELTEDELERAELALCEKARSEPCDDSFLDDCSRE